MDRGEVPAPPPLFLDQTWAGRSEKYFLETTPLLSQDLDAAPPLSQGSTLYYCAVTIMAILLRLY